MKIDSRLTWVIATIAFVILFIIILATMGDRCAIAAESLKRCGHAWTNWIYDFQALVAGFTALVAAMATVYTMFRNTREMIYVEWKTTVFKVDFLNKQLVVLIRILDNFIIDKAPKGANKTEWIAYVDAIHVKMINLESMLNDALDAGLSMYSLGMIRGDKERIAQLALDYKAMHGALLLAGPLTLRDIGAIKAKNSETHVAFGLIRSSTIFMFSAFLANTEHMSPHNLKL